MSSRTDNTKVAILKALDDGDGAAGAARVMDRLATAGVAIQPRTIRFYLLQLDREGMTRLISRRRGRVLTEKGREELARANVMDKVGFVAARVDTLGYRMSFDLARGKGTIITNISLVDQRGLSFALNEIGKVFAAGYGMGTRLALAGPGERLGEFLVPAGMAGIGTVCSVTVNGIMLGERIPVTSRFGGLVEIRDGVPIRFVELIEYSGTTLDPLEAYIKAGMTKVRGCAQSGSGIIGGSFREIPSAAIEQVGRVQKAMKKWGLSGILAVGKPNRPLLDIPVAEGRTGIIVIGGLNPVAAVHEAGLRITMKSLAGLSDLEQFSDYREVIRRHG